jgi:hypothetical protein
MQPKPGGNQRTGPARPVRPARPQNQMLNHQDTKNSKQTGPTSVLTLSVSLRLRGEILCQIKGRDSLLTQRPAGLSMSAMRTRLPVSGCLLLSAACLCSIASAQTNWVRTYGGADNDDGYSVQQTSDGGYIIAGYAYSYGAGGRDVYLIRTNSRGDTLWSRAFGGPNDDVGYSVQQTTDGGYIVAGYTGYRFDTSYSAVYLVKTNAQGDTLWTRTYGGDSGDDAAYSVDRTSDGGFVVAGGTSSFGADPVNVWLLRTNASGDTLWTQTYGEPIPTAGHAVQVTSDGGYIVAGISGGSRGFYLVKTDSHGDTLWTRAYGDGSERGEAVQQTADGGYIVTGRNRGRPTEKGVCLLKTNAAGDSLWSRTYSKNGSYSGYSVQQTIDGGYIVAGTTDHVYLVRTDAQGDTLWTRNYYEGGGRCIRQTADGGYIVTGYTTDSAGNRDVCLIKTNPDLDVGPITILSPPGIAESGQVYVPSVVIRNFGLTAASFPVTMEIGSSYAQTVFDTLASERSDTVVFPIWTAGPVGSIKVTCRTTLFGDNNPTKDTIRDSVLVLPPPIHDVGAVAIGSPSGNVRAGDTVIPRARIRNFGNRSERFFDVRLRIGTSYNEKANVADVLPAGSAAELTFPPWVAEAGDWAVSCSTMLASDVVRANDKVSSSVQVFPQSLSIAPDQSDRIEAGQSRTYRFHALIQGDTGAVVEVTRPAPPPGWNVRLCNAAGTQDLTDTDGDGLPDLGFMAQGESSWFSLDVTAPSGTQGDTASLGQGVFLVAGHVGDRPDIADTAVLTLTLVPELSIHNFPNPFTDHTSFVLGLPEDGKASLTVYTRAGERVCRILTNADLPAGVHVLRWKGVNDNGRTIAPGTYEYLLDYVHAGKTDRFRKKLVLTRQ